MNNDHVRVKYIGEDDPLTLREGKEYDARVLQKGWFGIVDETNEEYAYPPELFEVLSGDRGRLPDPTKRNGTEKRPLRSVEQES